MKKRLVLLESPFAGKTEKERAQNWAYLKEAMRDSLARGEAPYASHLMYTQVLSDDIKEERALGIDSGFAWGSLAEASVVYLDFGVSPGMEKGIKDATEKSRPIEYRKIKKDMKND